MASAHRHRRIRAWLWLVLGVAGCTRVYTPFVPPTPDAGPPAPPALAATADPEIVPPRASSSITISGGYPPYAIAIPNPSSGSPTVAPTTSTGGPVTYTAGQVGSTSDLIVITDSHQQKLDLPVSVSPALSISPTSITRAPKTSWTFTVGGGAPPYSVQVQSPMNCPPPNDYWLADGGCPSYTDGGLGSCLESPTSATGVVSYRAGSCQEGSSDQLIVTDSVSTTVVATIDITTALALEPTGAQTVPGGLVFFQATGGLPPYTYNFTTAGNRSGGQLFAGGTYQAGPNPKVTDEIYAEDAVGVVVTVEIGVGDQQISLPTGRQYSLYTGDFNGDGFADAVAISQADSHPLVVTALGSSTGFISTTTLSLSTAVAQVVVGDFNHDGFDDLVIQPSSVVDGTATPLPRLDLLAGSGNGNFTVQPMIQEGVGVQFETILKVSSTSLLYSQNNDGFGHPGLSYQGPGSDALLVLVDVETLPDGGALDLPGDLPDGGPFDLDLGELPDGGELYLTTSDGGAILPYTQLQAWVASPTGNLAEVAQETFPSTLFAESNVNDNPNPDFVINYFNAVGVSLTQATFPDLASFLSPSGVPFSADFNYVSFVPDCQPYGGCFTPPPCGDGSQDLGTQWPIHLAQVQGYLADAGVAFGFNADPLAPNLFLPTVSLDGGWTCFPIPDQADPTSTVRGTFLAFDYYAPQPDFLVNDSVDTLQQLDKSLADGGFVVLPIGSAFGQATPLPSYWGTRALASVFELPAQVDQSGFLESTQFFGTVLSELDALGQAGIERLSYTPSGLVTGDTLPVSGVAAFITADIDGDGLIDGASIDSSGNLAFIRGGPTGQPYVGSARQLHRPTPGLDVGDFNADGLADLIVPDIGVRVFYGDVSGQVGAAPTLLSPNVAISVASGGAGAWALLLSPSTRTGEVAHLDLSATALANDAGIDYPVAFGDGGQSSSAINLDPSKPVQMAGMTVGGDRRAALILGTPLGGQNCNDGQCSPAGINVVTLGVGAQDSAIQDVGVDGNPLVAPITSAEGTDFLVSISSSSTCATGSMDVATAWGLPPDGGLQWTDRMGTLTVVPCNTPNAYGNGQMQVTGLFSVASQANGPLDTLVAALSTYQDNGVSAQTADGGSGACNILDENGHLEGAIAIWGASDIVEPASGGPPLILPIPVELACGAQASWNVAAADFDRDGQIDLLVSDGQVIALVSNLAAYRAWPRDLGPYPHIHYVLFAGLLDHTVAGDFNGDGWPDIGYTRSDIAELQVAVFHPDAGSYY